jgi:hypothetical protein
MNWASVRLGSARRADRAVTRQRAGRRQNGPPGKTLNLLRKTFHPVLRQRVGVITHAAEHPDSGENRGRQCGYCRGRDDETQPEAAVRLLFKLRATPAAIAAINDAGVHQFLLKPWSPPQDRASRRRRFFPLTEAERSQLRAFHPASATWAP